MGLDFRDENIPTGVFETLGDVELDTGEVKTDGTLAEGTRIGHYELIRLLGVGGKGQVWAARDIRLGRRVAIKFMNLPNAESAARFLVEAKATAQCQHENIVVVYEVDEDAGVPYLVLEHLEGETLEDLAARGPVPPGRAVDIGIAILRAVERAHSEGIIHRDLKPENVIITRNGGIKVLDFGMAKATDGELAKSDQSVTSDGQVLGTPAYMAPEQLTTCELDGRVDLWSFGVIMYRILAGQHPLGELINLSDLVSVSDMDVPMPSVGSVEGISSNLARVVDKCLRKDRDKRYRSATDTLKALEQVATQGKKATMTSADELPFVGLKPFQYKDAGRFLGREAETRRAVSWLDDHSLLAIVGPSGVGKTSLVLAGVGPALAGGGEVWKVVQTKPGHRPLMGLAAMIRKHIRENTSVEALANHLLDEPGYFARVLRRWCRAANKKLLLFVDQFEELYTQGISAEERIAYKACLAAVADDISSPLRLGIAVRSDFLEHAAEAPAFMDLVSRGINFLGPMDRVGLRDALVGPLEMVGYGFESEELVDEILGELESSEGPLPLLQCVCTQLWDRRSRANPVLTEDVYRQMGGITGALVKHADFVMTEFGAEVTPLVRAIFQRLVTAERTRSSATIADLAELGDSPTQTESLIERLVGARLLVVNTEGEKPTASIVHETLVLNWPRLNRWIEEEGEGHAFICDLQASSKRWTNNGKNVELLWGGQALKAARRWRVGNSDSYLTSREREFLFAAFAEEGKARKLQKTLLTAAAVIFGVFGIAGGLAIVTNDDDKPNLRPMQIVKKLEVENKALADKIAPLELENQKLRSELEQLRNKEPHLAPKIEAPAKTQAKTPAKTVAKTPATSPEKPRTRKRRRARSKSRSRR